MDRQLTRQQIKKNRQQQLARYFFCISGFICLLLVFRLFITIPRQLNSQSSFISSLGQNGFISMKNTVITLSIPAGQPISKYLHFNKICIGRLWKLTITHDDSALEIELLIQSIRFNNFARNNPKAIPHQFCTLEGVGSGS